MDSTARCDCRATSRLGADADAYFIGWSIFSPIWLAENKLSNFLSLLFSGEVVIPKGL